MHMCIFQFLKYELNTSKNTRGVKFTEAQIYWHNNMINGFFPIKELFNNYN